jgi:PAS domain S-box-containing protein
MIALDNPTLIFCSMVVTFSTTLGIAITQWTRKTYPGFSYWMVGGFSRSIGFLLYATVPGNSPLFILAASFDSAGLIANNRGVLIFRDRHHANFAWEIVLAVLWTSVFTFLSYTSRINDRVMLYSLYHCVYFGWSVVTLTTRRPAYAGAGDVLLTTSLVLWTLLDLTRGTYIGLFSPPVTASLSSHPLMAVYAVAVMVLVLMIALGKVMMNSQRLEYDFRAAQQSLEEDIIWREQYENELEGYRQHLEELVEERTTALSHSESKFRALVEQSLVGIYIYQDQYIRYANKALCQMLGYASVEAFVDRIPVIDLVDPKDRFSLLKRLARLAQGLDDESTYAMGLLRQDGKSVDVEVRSRAISFEGQTATIGVILDVSERNRATEGLRALASRLQSVREEERTRIARDLHDDLGQAMAVLKMKMIWVKNHLHPETMEAALSGITEIEEMIAHIAQSVHDISWALRPGVLDTLGLAAAIEWLGKDFQRRAGIRCHLDLSAKNIDLDADQITHLFRICQELMNNVVRHARASRIEVKLKFDRNGKLLLAVKDDGIGMGKTAPGSHSLGLLGIRERVQQLGGVLDIISTPKLKGTCIRVRVPHRTGTQPSACDKCNIC